MSLREKMISKKEKLVRTTVDLTESHHKALTEIKETFGSSFSFVINKALEQFLSLDYQVSLKKK